MIAAPASADRWRSFPADGLTPQRLAGILRAADEGDLSEQLALYEQMEEKDPHLYCVANTRRLAVTGLEWRIVSASEAHPEGAFDRALADAAAAHCRAVLGRIEDFDGVLSHLSLGLGRNIALAELVWEYGPAGVTLAEIVPVEFERLAVGSDGELRILTRAEPRSGEGLMADKFMVHRPNAASGAVGRGGLMRASALAYLGKQFALKDWLIFAEVFGMPVRVARYEPSASAEEKRELLSMLRNLGADAAGIFSKAVELEIKQTRVPGDTNPYESLCHFFNRELSKAWLGQTLTTDTARAVANLSAADVHDRVRRDLRDADLRAEARTIRRDLLSVLTRQRFGPGAEAPYFVRQSASAEESARLGAALSVAVNELGARVPAGWAHTALGIPQAREGEAALSGKGTA
ncbi:MAG: DUF935 family protein [Phycisphaerae bacterium]